MVKRIGQKLRGAAGASVIMALSIMMVVAALSASMLSIAITAPQVAITQQKEEQAYLAATSTARLLQDILNSSKKSELLTSLTSGTLPQTLRLVNPSGTPTTLIEASVTAVDNSVANKLTVTISAQGYTLKNVTLTYT